MIAKQQFYAAAQHDLIWFKKIDEDEQKLATTDYQLFEALTLLKGLSVVASRK